MTIEYARDSGTEDIGRFAFIQAVQIRVVGRTGRVLRGRKRKA